MDARQALRPHGWGLQRVLPGARPARGNPGAQRRGRMMGAQRFLVGLPRDSGRQEAGYRANCLKPFAYSFGER